MTTATKTTCISKKCRKVPMEGFLICHYHIERRAEQKPPRALRRTHASLIQSVKDKGGKNDFDWVYPCGVCLNFSNGRINNMCYSCFGQASRMNDLERHNAITLRRLDDEDYLKERMEKNKLRRKDIGYLY